MSEALRNLLDRYVADGVVPGAVALVGGRDAEPIAAGRSAVGGPAMRPDAIMRIQSMTKAVSAVAALRLVESGRLGLDDAVAEWLPELADRRVLTAPTAELNDTVPAARPITVRHLLTNMSGYGMILDDSPLARAMRASQTEAGAEPPTMGADDWLARLAELPLVGQPGEVWRYHHSFAILGVLISRVTGAALGEIFQSDLFGPLGMVDTAFWVPPDQLDRLPAAYRHEGGRLTETEPAGGGFYAGPPPFDVSHNELVSTARDYHRFIRALIGAEGGPLVSGEHLRQLSTDQVPAAAKTDDSFFPGFWAEMGWGFGVGVQTAGGHAGRFGWSGGQGTDFFVDPDGTVAVLLTQVELGEAMGPMLNDFQRQSA